MALDLRSISDSWWSEIGKKVQGGVVFIDDHSSECLHWHGGLPRLLESGAISVRLFSSFESGLPNEEKAVFITCSPVVGSIRMILRDIITSSKFKRCVLITGCSPAALTLATTGNVTEGYSDLTAIGKLEMDMLKWMKGNPNENLVEIHNYPMSLVSVTDYLFFAPPFQDLFPFLEADLEGKLPGGIFRKIDAESMGLELQTTITHLVTTLNSLFTQLQVKEEIFYVGCLSEMVANKLQALTSSSSRSKTFVTKASLIFIDRTLDISSVTQLGSECILDRIKAVLPNFPGHSIDVSVKMGSVTTSKINGAVAPGCLFQEGSNFIDTLICKRPKDILTALYGELASREPNPSPVNFVSAKALEKQVANIAKDFKRLMPSIGLIQEVLAVTQTLSSPQISILEIGESIEKLIMSIITSEGVNPAVKELRELIQTRQERELGLETLLTTLVFFYAVLGDRYQISDLLEASLKSAFCDALFEDKDNLLDSVLSPLLPMGDDVTVKDMDAIGERIFLKLRRLRGARTSLQKYRSLVHDPGPSHPLEFTPLIRQFVTDIVDPSRPDIPDLLNTSSGITDSIRSKFSLLLTPTKPHPMDNETIIIFVLGGITGQEIQAIKRTFDLHRKQVLIGSTTLATSTSVLSSLFVKDPLKPISL